jgi:membrane protease YdiL (CAAX protease family)
MRAEGWLVGMMDATNSTDETHASPYGLIGLSLSLIAAIVLALILMGAGAGLSYLAVMVLRGAPTARAAVDSVIAALQADNEFSAARLALGLIFYLAALVALLLIAGWRGGRNWRALVAWRPPTWPVRDKVLWGIAALGLIYGLASSAALGYFYPKSNSWLLLPRDHLAAALLFIVAVVMAPVAEETYFRGWIFTSLRHKWGHWPAVLISALLFALAHYESTHLYALAVFPLGLILAALRARTGSARTSMVFHAANNLIAFLSAGVGGS